MSRKNLMQYFGLVNLDNTQFGNTFFNTFKGIKEVEGGGGGGVASNLGLGGGGIN